MLSPMYVFAICLGVSLVVGGIVTATYVSIENKKNPNTPVSTTTIVFMMGSFLLLGLLSYAIYHVSFVNVKGIPVDEVILTKTDVDKVVKCAERIQKYNDTINKLPEVNVEEICKSKDVCFGNVKPKPPSQPPSHLPSQPSYKPYGGFRFDESNW